MKEPKFQKIGRLIFDSDGDVVVIDHVAAAEYDEDSSKIFVYLNADHHYEYTDCSIEDFSLFLKLLCQRGGN